MDGFFADSRRGNEPGAEVDHLEEPERGLSCLGSMDEAMLVLEMRHFVHVVKGDVTTNTE